MSHEGERVWAVAVSDPFGSNQIGEYSLGCIITLFCAKFTELIAMVVLESWIFPFAL